MTNLVHFIYIYFFSMQSQHFKEELFLENSEIIIILNKNID